MASGVLRGGLVWDGSSFEVLDVYWNGSTIARITPSVALTGHRDELDCRDFIVLPGLTNAHTHSHNVYWRGALGSHPLEVLVSSMAIASVPLSPDELRWAVLLNGLENLKSGVTAVCDNFSSVPLSPDHLDAVADAYAHLGLRAIVGLQYTDLAFHAMVPGLYDQLPRDLRRAVRSTTVSPVTVSLSELAAHGRVLGSSQLTVGLAPTIPMLCSDELLSETVRLATEGMPVFTHLAESAFEAHRGNPTGSDSIVARLDRLGFLGADTVLAHAVWVGGADIQTIAERGSVIVHVPGSNLRLGVGIAPVREFLNAGIPVAVGTDGSASSDNQSILAATRLATLVSRLRSVDPNQWLSPVEAFEMGTATASALPGLPTDYGRVRPGAAADLVLIRKSSIPLHPPIDMLSNLVLAESGSAIDSIMIGGRFVLRAGSHVGVSEDAVVATIDEIAARKLRDTRGPQAIAQQVAPYVVACCRRFTETRDDAVLGGPTRTLHVGH